MFVNLLLIFIHEKQIVDILQKVIDSSQGRPRSQGQASFRYKHVTSTIATWTISGESFEYVPTYAMEIWSLPNWKKKIYDNENFKLMSLDEGDLREWDENTFHTPFKTSDVK